MATNAITANKISSPVDGSSRVDGKKKTVIQDDSEIWVGGAKIFTEGGIQKILCGCHEHRDKNVVYDNEIVWAREHQEKRLLNFQEDPCGSGVIITMTPNAIGKFLGQYYPELSEQIEAQKSKMSADDIKNSLYIFDYKKNTITFGPSHAKKQFDKWVNSRESDPKKVPIPRAPAGPAGSGFTNIRTTIQIPAQVPTQEPVQETTPAHWAQHKPPVTSVIAEAEAERKKKEEHARALKQAAIKAEQEARAAFASETEVNARTESDAIAEAQAKAQEAVRLAREKIQQEEAMRAKALEAAREAVRIKREKEIAEEAMRIAEIEAAREEAKRKVAMEVERRKKEAELAEKKRLHEIQEDATAQAFAEAGLPYTRTPFALEKTDTFLVNKPVELVAPTPKPTVYTPPTAEQLQAMMGFAYGTPAPAQHHDPKYEAWCNKPMCNGIGCDYNHQGCKICKNEFERKDKGGCTFIGCTFNHLAGHVEKMVKYRADYRAGKFKKQSNAPQPSTSQALSDLELMDAPSAVSSASVQKPAPKVHRKKPEKIDQVIDSLGPIVPALTHLDINAEKEEEQEDPPTPTEEEVLTNAVKRMEATM